MSRYLIYNNDINVNVEDYLFLLNQIQTKNCHGYTLVNPYGDSEAILRYCPKKRKSLVR